MPRVTKHAKTRVRQRLGIPKRSAKRITKQAFRHGIQHGDTTGGLNRYLTKLYFSHGSANNIRVYHNNVYIFSRDKLITVFPLPQKFRQTAEEIEKVRNKK